MHCGGSPSSAHLIYVHTYLIVYWFIGWFISLRCKSPQQKMRPSSYFKTVFQWVTLVSEEANCDLAFPPPLEMNNSFAINIQSVEAFLVYYLWEVVLFSGSRQKWKHKEKKKKENQKQKRNKKQKSLPLALAFHDPLYQQRVKVDMTIENEAFVRKTSWKKNHKLIQKREIRKGKTSHAPKKREARNKKCRGMFIWNWNG